LRRRGIRHRLVARLGGQGHAAARREGGRRTQLRAHPPIEPGRHGRAAAAVPRRTGLGDAGPARRRALRHRRAGRARAAAGDRDDDPSQRRQLRGGAAAIAHRHADRGRLLPPRRHPAVRAARAAFVAGREGTRGKGEGESLGCGRLRAPAPFTLHAAPATDGRCAGRPTRPTGLHFAVQRSAVPVHLSESSPHPMSGEAGLATFPRLLLAIGIAFLACLVAQLISFHTIDLLLIWPGAAVAFAFAWRYGTAWALAAAAGAALWAWIEFANLRVTLAAFAASAVGPMLAAQALRALNEWKPPEYRLETTVRFLAIIVLVSAPVDALFGGA